jgi:hypothetical protein
MYSQQWNGRKYDFLFCSSRRHAEVSQPNHGSSLRTKDFSRSNLRVRALLLCNIWTLKYTTLTLHYTKQLTSFLTYVKCFNAPIIPSVFLFLCTLFVRKQSCDVARMSYTECDHAPVYPFRKCIILLQAHGRLRIVALSQLHLTTLAF